MYEDIIEIAENRALANKLSSGPRVSLLNDLPDYIELNDLEQELKTHHKINFKHVFHEPVGYYLLKCFLESEYSVAKAVFISDVELYKTIRDPSTRRKVALLIFDRFVSDSSNSGNEPVHESVFERKAQLHRRVRSTKAAFSNEPSEQPPETEIWGAGGTNAIGVYGKSVRDVKDALSKHLAPCNLFDAVAQDVLDDLRMDVFPRFLKSRFYRRYIQAKWYERQPVTVDDFNTLRVLGRGAFGAVNASFKKNSGTLYAMKCINKKRVMATNGLDTVMAERNFLSEMNSDFVVCLKFAVHDKDSLYLVLDCMTGGDLKYHLNRDEVFDENRSRFYAAEVLLGLEHLHSHNIIYRDMKLENVLLDEKGHCRVSDLGLAVKGDRARGYAGTPGYTAPEVILGGYYNKYVDFFSYGVMVYRFLCGKKPFRKGSGDLDKNVLEVEPPFPADYFSPQAVSLLKGLMEKDPKKRLGSRGFQEIKDHPWFSCIDFGLLEAGYLDPPFVPSVSDINAESTRHLGRPPHDEKYAKVKLTPEFEEKVTKLDFISFIAMQTELVDVFQKADEGRNFGFGKRSESFSRMSTRDKRPAADTDRGSTRNKSCCAIL